MKPDLQNGKDGLPSLARAIAAIRREVLAAVADNAPLPAETRLEPGRIVLTLGIVINEDGELEVVTSGKSGHTVTVEFAIRREGDERPDTVSERQRQASTAAGIANALMEVFGVPSFDSSARATVFRETMAKISEEQAHKLILLLESGPAAEIPSDLKFARRMVGRLLEKGPAGIEGGATVLRQILAQGTLATLLRIIEDTWKTPEAWAQ